MGGIRTAGDLVAWMQMARRMKINDAKAYVADKLGVDVIALTDEAMENYATGLRYTVALSVGVAIVVNTIILSVGFLVMTTSAFKMNVDLGLMTILSIVGALILDFLLLPALLLYGINLYLNRRLIKAFHKTDGPYFAISAVLYYTFLYPFAVGIGAFSAIFSQHFGFRS